MKHVENERLEVEKTIEKMHTKATKENKCHQYEMDNAVEIFKRYLRALKNMTLHERARRKKDESSNHRGEAGER